MKYLSTLFILLVFSVVIRQASAQDSQVPSLSFAPAEIDTASDDTFVTELIIDTAGVPAGGVGAKVQFDPAVLEVVEVRPTDLFADYPSLTHDNQSGAVVVSGIVRDVNQLFTGSGAFAIVTWRAKQPGATDISYLYTEGDTKDSNIAVLFGTGDALKQVHSTRINITDAEIAALPIGSTQSDSVATVVDLTEKEEEIGNLKVGDGVLWLIFALTLGLHLHLLYRQHVMEKKIDKLLGNKTLVDDGF